MSACQRVSVSAVSHLSNRQPGTGNQKTSNQVGYTCPVMEDGFFTISEARSLLPIVRNLTEAMVQLARELHTFHPQIRGLAERGMENTGSPEGTRYLTYLLRMQDCVRRIQRLGCLVKGVEDGLVDFPHLKEGREVYLCWKLGEDDIHYWHETDAGFAGRMPLEEE